MKPYNLPISYRFSLAALLVEAVILVFLLYFGVTTLKEHMGYSAQKHALHLSSILGQSLAEPLVRKDYSQLTDIIRSNVRDGALGFALIYNSKGNVVANEGDAYLLKANKMSHTSVFEAVDQKCPYFIFQAPVRLADIQYGTIRFGLPLQSVYQAKEDLIKRYLKIVA